MFIVPGDEQPSQPRQERQVWRWGPPLRGEDHGWPTFL
jgi:hypothetical protein